MPRSHAPYPPEFRRQLVELDPEVELRIGPAQREWRLKHTSQSAPLRVREIHRLSPIPCSGSGSTVRVPLRLVSARPLLLLASWRSRSARSASRRMTSMRALPIAAGAPPGRAAVSPRSKGRPRRRRSRAPAVSQRHPPNHPQPGGRCRHRGPGIRSQLPS